MGKLIAIDNGHGLATAGKRTPKWTDGTKSIYTKKNYMHEWEFNYGVAKRLKVELERNGFDVLMVSDTEADTPIRQRCKVANDAKADIFVSVHANALGNTWNNNVKGIETLTSGKGDSLRLGTILQKHMVNDTGLVNRGLKDGAWLGVVRLTKMPCVLLEGGFMDNPSEARLLNSNEYRDVFARAVAKGICEYYGINYK